MSLLTQNTHPDITQRAARAAEQLKSVPQQMMEMMVNQWNTAYDNLWNTRGDVTSAMKLEAIGTSGAELFNASAAFTEFILVQCAGKRQDIVTTITTKVNAIPAHTIHSDGTVTLN